MEIIIKLDCSGVNWDLVSETLRDVGMAYYDPDVHKKAFENSHTCVFVYYGPRLIGFGRAVSDNVYQAAIYDVAVTPEFQNRGIGATIIKNIFSKNPNCNFILYASPGKEGFYEKLGLRKMKTGMALFKNADNMKRRGFIE